MKHILNFLALALCRMGWHPWVVWEPTEAERCANCLKWKAGHPPPLN